jgi:hypothetical protein
VRDNILALGGPGDEIVTKEDVTPDVTGTLIKFINPKSNPNMVKNLNAKV